MSRFWTLFLAAIVIVGAALLLGGCTAGTQAVIDGALAQSEAGVKAFNDREAVALKQAPCAIRVGAFNRVLTDRERDAVMALCQGAESLTFEDLANMGRAIDLLRHEAPETFQ